MTRFMVAISQRISRSAMHANPGDFFRSLHTNLLCVYAVLALSSFLFACEISALRAGTTSSATFWGCFPKFKQLEINLHQPRQELGLPPQVNDLLPVFLRPDSVVGFNWALIIQ